MMIDEIIRYETEELSESETRNLDSYGRKATAMINSGIIFRKRKGLRYYSTEKINLMKFSLKDKRPRGKECETGDKVTYINVGKREKGIVKSIADDGNPFVVYNCNEDWEDYWEYTAAKTKIKNLIKGWD